MAVLFYGALRMLALCGAMLLAAKLLAPMNDDKRGSWFLTVLLQHGETMAQVYFLYPKIRVFFSFMADGLYTGY